MGWASDDPTLGLTGKDRQYRANVIEYHRRKTLPLLNIRAHACRLGGMKHLLISFALIAGLAVASTASAADCYADYKAKRDNPLRLHYGVVQLQGACKRGPAKSEVSARLAQGGWKLLNVLSVFGPEGLDQRRANAGSFYLRF
ncbi:MAG: hypothetical protein ACI8R4_002337 [Paracoccaceae bacterium]|jgi:hypothetical protein